jgi:hypothetical protein
MRIMF